MSVQVERRRFTVDEYERMGRAGILHEDDRVELIRGEIVRMAGIGSRHAGVVNFLTHALAQRVGQRAVVSVQNPLRFWPWSEPQPDVVVAAARADFYRSAHPTAEDVLLVVEVSDTTQGYDRGTKVPLYAEHGVREVWLFDVVAEVLEVYREPRPEGYRRVVRLERSGSVSLEALPDVTLSVDEVLG